MIVVLKPGVCEEKKSQLTDWLAGQGLSVHPALGGSQTILGLRNVLSRVDVTVLEQSASGVAVEGPLSPQDVLVKSSARPVAAGDSVRVEQP